MWTFRTGLLIGLAVAIAIGAGGVTYERYDTKCPTHNDCI